MGRIVLVSDGSRGIGAETVRRLAADGWDVGFSYQSDGQAARKVEKAASELGARVLATQADITCPDAVTAWVGAVEEELGPVSALVTCAGITREKPLALMEDADWRAVIDTNLDGVFNLCRAAVPPMMKRRCGQIVAISSVSGVYGSGPDGPAGRAGHLGARVDIAGFIESLAREVGRFGIRANAVVPGMIHADTSAILPDTAGARVTETIALRRFGTAAEVASMVALLLSGQAPGVTGRNGGTLPLGTVPLGTIPLGTAPLGTAPLGTAPLGTAPRQGTVPPPRPPEPDNPEPPLAHRPLRPAVA
jgi:3-oxoacyl-[acyl-carrier protein] reductase